ncbi:hypothetical protein Godav_027958 [Gossypium davidsonii]|uniref:Uncharacterized protein n=1 Tax=Gossypium davidsonii TaxID=34287 RepID=A0A7J8RYB7_GOSDV|nr:hypothetical protein [Gossypium davidsonii]
MEACKGFLKSNGEWLSSAKAEGSLIANPTCRAGMKVGLSDPIVSSGRAVTQQIKVTLGIIDDIFVVLEDWEGRTSSVLVIVPTVNAG